MKEIISPLFVGLTDEEYKDLQSCACMSIRKFEKSTSIFCIGNVVHKLGVVLDGAVKVENVDFWGNKSILTHISEGQIFAESYAVTGMPLQVSAIAAEMCTIQFMDVIDLLGGRYVDASWYKKVIQNLLRISANKNLMLSSHIFQTSFKRARPRIESYLTSVSLEVGSREFDIPFNRQQLADYLNLDRSALSKELARMHSEKLIDFHKNHFRLRTQ